MNSGIYSATNTINGNRYVGRSVDLIGRFAQHKSTLLSETHHNTHLQRAWNKYGEAAFKFEVLEYWEPEFLVSMEQWWMNMLQPEYNSAPVSASNLGVKRPPPTDEAIANMSAAQKGRKHPEETLAKMSAWQKGRKKGPLPKITRDKIGAAHKGMKRSEETRAKMSLAGKGRKFSDEHKARLSASAKGRKMSEETKNKLSLANKGKKLSREHKAKISASQKDYWATRKAAYEARCTS